MPNTFAFMLLYWVMESRTEHNSAVQVLVKAKGKNNSKTLDPFCSESITLFLSLSYKEKSGARSPG